VSLNRETGWQLRVGLIRAQHLPKAHISKALFSVALHSTYTRPLTFENVPKMNIAGAADPYVTLDITGQKQRKSKTIKNTLSPEWKEEFVFALPSVPRTDDKAELVMSVRNYDQTPQKDEVIGEVRFTLADLAGKSSTHTLNLMKPGQNPTKVSSIVASYGQYTRTLTFENWSM